MLLYSPLSIPPSTTPSSSPPPTHTHTEANLCDLRTQYASLLSEFEYWVDEAWVEGAIPAELLGTYFRNGPGLLVNTARHERHIFGEAGCMGEGGSGGTNLVSECSQG